MKLIDYINSMDDAQQADYAVRCGTTHGYLINHIKHARKECRKPLREALAAQSNGKVRDKDVLKHFGII